MLLHRFALLFGLACGEAGGSVFVLGTLMLLDKCRHALAHPSTVFSYLFLCSIAQAEIGDSQLPQVVVSATRFEESLSRVPADVRVISAEDIGRSGAVSLPALFVQLGTIPVSGANLGQLGLGANVDLGGYGVTAPSTTLILVDGLRINPPDSTSISWEVIPLHSIERIEVMYGGSSVQFGNGAVGGVVNIITRKGSAKNSSFEQTLGSFNTLITNGSFGRALGDDAYLSIHASRMSTDGWRENSAARTNSVRLRYTKELARSDSVFVEAYVSDSLSQLPGGVLGKAGEGDPRAAKFNNVGTHLDGGNATLRAGINHAISQRVDFEGEASYRERTSDLTAPYYATADSVNQAWGFVTGPYKSFLNGWDVALTPRIRINLGNGKSLVTGYDLSRSSQSSSNQFSDIAQQVILANQGSSYYGNLVIDSQKVTLTNHSLYLISRTPLTSDIDLTGGVRRQWQDASATDINKSSANGMVNTQQSYSADAIDLSLNYRFSERDRVYLKWDRSFRFANVDEFWGFDSSMNRIFSGALRPQSADAVEAGGSWHHGPATLVAAVFRSVSRDEIRYDPLIFANNNSPDDIRRTGLRWSLNYRWSPQFTLSASGRQQQSVYVSGPYIGNSVSLVPETTMALRVDYAPVDQANLGFVTSFVGGQHYDASPAISQTLAKLPAYWTTDLYAHYRKGPWELKAAVRNLAGDSYATYGGYGFVSLPAASGGNRYYYFPSDPRALLATIRYNF